MSLLDVRDLRVYYDVIQGEVKAVDGVDLVLDRGRTLGLVGESGCGKTTAAFAVMKLLPRNGKIVTGKVRFDGETVIRAPLISELKYYSGREDWEARVRAILDERKAEAAHPTSFGPSEPGAPLTAREKDLVERVEDVLRAENGADPEAVREKLQELVRRQERRFHRDMSRRSRVVKEEEAIRELRWARISMIFQGAMNAFNPVYKVGSQIKEALQAHMDLTSEEEDERVAELFSLVGLDRDLISSYPHEFSGGMKQRAMIAMSLALNPDIIIADEPTTALDVTIQAQIVDLVKRLRDDLNMTVVWITHDLGVVARLAQRVIVMYAGYIIEEAPVKELYANPTHPYSIGLLGSLPSLTTDDRKRLTSIPGLPPVLLEKPVGCPFAVRCDYAFDRCKQENPPLMSIGSLHRVACWWDVQEGRPRNA